MNQFNRQHYVKMFPYNESEMIALFAKYGLDLSVLHAGHWTARLTTSGLTRLPASDYFHGSHYNTQFRIYENKDSPKVVATGYWLPDATLFIQYL